MYKLPFLTESLTEAESLLRLSKLECRDIECEGIYFDRGCFKAAIPDRHTGLDNSEMFLPQLEFPAPVNAVCTKCVDISEIATKIPIRKSSGRTILNDFAVNDVIVCEKSPMGRFFGNPKAPKGRYMCINSPNT